jgi:hypothetical protein
MFKYISDIISQFSTGQKIIALLILVLSIIIITLGPSLIDAINVDKEEMKSIILEKSKKIDDLNKEVDTLQKKIRDGQIICTNEIFQREKNFIQMLDDLQAEARKEQNSSKILRKESFITNSIDTTVMMMPQERSTNTVIIKNDMSKMIKEIDKMKEKIKN